MNMKPVDKLWARPVKQIPFVTFSLYLNAHTTGHLKPGIKVSKGRRMPWKEEGVLKIVSDEHKVLHVLGCRWSHDRY
jgi:hypothetical protein